MRIGTAAFGSLAVVLVACTPFGEAHDKAVAKGDAVTTTAPSLPTSTKTTDSAPLPGDDGGGATDGDGGSISCSSPHVPQATFAVDQVHGDVAIAPVDVYVTQDSGELSIILTEAAQACDLRKNHLTSANVNELAVVITTDGESAFPAGTYDSSSDNLVFELQSTHFACALFSSDLTDPVKHSNAIGTVHITTHSATLLTGDVDVTDSTGRRTKFTFSAPICDSGGLLPANIGMCCSGS
jgi:hypothetical protein